MARYASNRRSISARSVRWRRRRLKSSTVKLATIVPYAIVRLAHTLGGRESSRSVMDPTSVESRQARIIETVRAPRGYEPQLAERCYILPSIVLPPAPCLPILRSRVLVSQTGYVDGKVLGKETASIAAPRVSADAAVDPTDARNGQRFWPSVHLHRRAKPLVM